jgi:23S rRNA pseudouridine2457 synthase
MNFYCAIYKPFNVLSQFTSQDGKQTLKDFFDVPADVYAVGRLDYDSEGLLILTNDKKLNHALLNPLHEHTREYWVQVDGLITNEAIQQLQQGVTVSIDGKKHCTKKCRAAVFTTAPQVPDRDPPVRFRKNIPTSWIKIQLTEGKNRQVRRMTAAVGFPTLRLIRHSIEKCTIQGLQPGEMRLFEEKEMYHLLAIKR